MIGAREIVGADGGGSDGASLFLASSKVQASAQCSKPQTAPRVHPIALGYP